MLLLLQMVIKCAGIGCPAADHDISNNKHARAASLTDAICACDESCNSRSFLCRC